MAETTTTLTLADFLLARIAEDEEVAGWYEDDTTPTYGLVNGMHPHQHDGLILNPSRLLAECKAKRVAVDWYLNDDDTAMSATVKAMAAVYADHPDYRQEWRP